MVQVPDKHFDSLQGMASIYSLWCFAPQGINTYDPLQTVKGVYLGLNHVIFVVYYKGRFAPSSHWLETLVLLVNISIYLCFILLWHTVSG